MRIFIFIFLYLNSLLQAQIPKFDWIIAEGHKSDVGFSLITTDPFKNTLAIINFGLSPFEICGDQFNSNSEYIDIEYLIKYDNKGQCIWQHQFTDNFTGGTGSGIFLTTDVNANIFIGAAFTGTIWLDDLNFLKSPDGIRESFVAKLDSNGKLMWYKMLKLEEGKLGDVSVHGLRSDLNGNIYFSAYHSQSQLFFEGIPIEYTSNSGYYKSTIFKLDPEGNLLWYKKFEAYGSIFQEIKINSKNQVVLAGSFSGSDLTVDSNVIENRNIAKPEESSDAVLTVLDQNGNVVYLQSIGGKGSDYLMTLEIDNEDNIFVGGTSFLSEEIEILSGRVKRLKANREWNNYLAKIKPNYELEWLFDDQQVFGHFGIYNILLNKNQDLWVSCKLEPDTFYLNNIPYFCSSNSSPDILYLRLDTKGEIRQVFQIHGKGRDYGNYGHWSGGLHSDGGLVISGTFTSDTLYFGDYALPKVARKQIGDQYTSSAFIARISPDGMVGSEDILIHKQGQFSILPNLTRDQLFIKFDEECKAHGILEILSLSGTLVQSKHIAQGALEVKLDVQNMATGIYFCRFRDQIGNHFIEKFVVE